MAALPSQIAHAQRDALAVGALLAGVDAAAITSRAALAMLAGVAQARTARAAEGRAREP